MLPDYIKLYIRNRLFYPLISRLPVRLSYMFATLKGVLDSKLHSKRVAAAITGIQSAFPEMSYQQASLAIRSQMRMLARERLDVYWLNRLNAKNCSKFIELDGLENLESAIADTRPVILYSAHFSRLIMPSMALGVSGIQTSCLTADISNPEIPPEERRYLARKLNDMGRLMGGDVIQKSDSLRRLYKVLKAKGILIVILDAPPAVGDSTERFALLGGEARLSTGVIKLAKRMDAILVPYFAVEEKDGLKGYFLEPFSIQGESDERALARVFEPIEQFIRERPDQWWMWSALPAIWQKH